MYLLGAWILLQDAVVADHWGRSTKRKARRSRRFTPTHSRWPRGAICRRRGRGLRSSVRRACSSRRPASVSPTTELMDMRSLKSTGIAEPSGSAEIFLLFSKKGIVETRFISGDEKPERCDNYTSTRATSLVLFPDNGPEKIARRGIVSCSQYTKANCTFVLLLPANTKP